MSLQACVGDSPVGTPGADGGPDAASNTDAQADAPSSDAASDAPPSSVTGTVIDERSIPIAGADVRIAGADAKTDSSGKFTVTAPSTYDVLIVNSTTNGNVVTTSGKKVTGFFGLSSRTPTLQVTGATTHSTTVTVNTTGVTPPLPNGDQWYVVTAPSNLSSSRLIGLSPNNVSTPSTINWEGNAPSTGNFYGYLLTVVNSFPTAWKSQTPATAYTMPAGTATFAAAFTPGVATGDLAITIDPGSDTMASLFVGHEPAPGARKIFGAFSFSATSITPKMPMAGTCSVTARGTTASGASAVTWRVALKAPSSVTVKLPVGDLKTTTPATNATGVGSGTSFAWTPVAGYMYYTRINCGSPTPTYLADFVTDSPSFTLPDTSALGVSVPASAACSWVVNAFAPVANVDGLVGPAGWINAQDTNFGTVDGTELRTGSSLFTSK